MKQTFYLLFLFVCLACQNAVAQNLETINFNGQQRTMLVHAPSDIQANAPLVISLHGANQDANYQHDQTQWDNCADSAKFVVVYPNAINKFWDTGNNSNDLKFIEHIMSLMYDRYQIDLNRIYISGFSLGAMMTYVCMDYFAEKVAAFAPVSGVRFDNRKPSFNKHVSFIHTHGTGDDVFKWVGDLGHAAGGYPFIPDYVEGCANIMGLSDKTELKPYPTNKSNSKDYMIRWSKAGEKAEVWLLALDGVGHWHSEAQGYGGINTTQEIWNFFRRHRLAEPIIPDWEDNSFDLPLTTKNIYFTVQPVLSFSIAKASMKMDGTEIELGINVEGDRLALSIPETADLKKGTYTVEISGVKNSAEKKRGIKYSYTYSFGVEDVMAPDADPTTTAYKYKGAFLRLWERAVYVYENTAHVKGAKKSFRSQLKTVMDKYDGFVSTSPTLYAEAVAELQPVVEKMEPYVDPELSAIQSAEGNVTKVVGVEYYSADGMLLSAPQKGLNLVKTTRSDNTVEVKKVLR